MNTKIKPGTSVSFDSCIGKTVGKVSMIQTCITNGAPITTVALSGGGTVALPFNHLCQEANQ